MLVPRGLLSDHANELRERVSNIYLEGTTQKLVATYEYLEEETMPNPYKPRLLSTGTLLALFLFGVVALYLAVGWAIYRVMHG